jgi:hypothetical protein
VSGDNIFVRPATYTEDLALKIGVNIVTFRGNGNTGNVIIIGNATFSGAGQVNISSIRLQTNSNFFLTVSGANASVVNLIDCDLRPQNNTGISFTSSNAASTISLINCTGNIGNATSAIYSMTSPGTLFFDYVNVKNSGASTVPSSNSAGLVQLLCCTFLSPFSTTGTGIITKNFTIVDSSAQNVTSLTTAGTGTSVINFGGNFSGTASAISIGAGTTVTASTSLISSSATNAVTGLGTFQSALVEYTGSSVVDNVTTLTPFTIQAVSVRPNDIIAVNAQKNLYGIANGTTGQVLTATTGSAPAFANAVDLHVARYIVSAGGAADGANFTTIATAYAAAVAVGAPQTVFVQPGSYTENITLTPGIDITAFGCDNSLNGTGNVKILGTLTLTTAGSVTISGIQLQTNSAALLAVTGSAASIVNLNNCYLNCTNNTGITYSSSNAASAINIEYCHGNIGTTGISLFTASSTGMLSINYSKITNTGSSTTASTISSGNLNVNWTAFNIPITTSSTGTIACLFCNVDNAATNTTSLTLGGGSINVENSYISSGTASAINISAVASNVLNNVISSSNTNAITGSGTIGYSGLSFIGGSTTINVTTQNVSGTLQGSKNTAPTAGFLGEQIRSFIPFASAVSQPTSNVPVNLTSISVTAGVWDISCIAQLQCTGSTTQQFVGMNLTSATLAITGDNTISTGAAAIIGQNSGLSIPAWRQTFSTTTTVFLVINCIFTTGTVSSWGRISATRVG